MKKILFAALMLFAVRSESQLLRSPLYCNSIGHPCVILNSYGTLFGQVTNVSQGVWGLSYGSSQETNGTSALTWNTSGVVSVPGTLSVTGGITGNAATASALYAAGTAASSGYLCRGVNASGSCLPAYVDTAATSGSTNTVTSGSMYTALSAKAALAGAVMTGPFRPAVKTKAELDAITPAVGDEYLCSDCTVPYDTCVGTAATPSGFRATIYSAISTVVPGTLVPKGCGVGE